MNVLDNLPEPAKLKDLMRILAVLNIILCKEEWLRYHSFDPKWDEQTSMAKIDNGAGDHLFILFGREGSIIKGFDHESHLSPHAREEFAIWPGIYEDVPKDLLALIDDNAFEKEDVTFCLWYGNHDSAWQKGKVGIPVGEEDGSGFLLGTILGTAEDFVEFAEGYFDVSLSLELVTQIYKGQMLTEAMIQALNPDCSAKEVIQDLESLLISPY